MSDRTLPQQRSHPRKYEQNKFVYPVLSRRSKGISIGVNLNPDKVCNFDCIYCQVDRRSEAETRFVEMDRLLAEIDDMLAYVVSGQIYADPAFQIPEPLRRLNDIAFSGDGEPTTFRNFDDIIERVAELKKQHGLPDVKLVLITNASMFHRPRVQRGLQLLDQNNGEIWAKLDAGTESYYQLIERTKIPFRQVIENITSAARLRPLIIQSLFMNVAGDPPAVAEIDAYIARLNEIQQAGGQIKLVQVYTVARPPAESFVTPLADAEVDAIAERVRGEAGIAAESYYS
jgi:wyosine [tRNA(Phe)-imidazoG37] synthetase (radical SAM superfamily)